MKFIFEIYGELFVSTNCIEQVKSFIVTVTFLCAVFFLGTCVPMK